MELHSRIRLLAYLRLPDSLLRQIPGVKSNNILNPL